MVGTGWEDIERVLIGEKDTGTVASGLVAHCVHIHSHTHTLRHTSRWWRCHNNHLWLQRLTNNYTRHMFTKRSTENWAQNIIIYLGDFAWWNDDLEIISTDVCSIHCKLLSVYEYKFSKALKQQKNFSCFTNFSLLLSFLGGYTWCLNVVKKNLISKAHCFLFFLMLVSWNMELTFWTSTWKKTKVRGVDYLLGLNVSGMNKAEDCGMDYTCFTNTDGYKSMSYLLYIYISLCFHIFATFSICFSDWYDGSMSSMRLVISCELDWCIGLTFDIGQPCHLPPVWLRVLPEYTKKSCKEIAFLLKMLFLQLIVK